MPSKQKSQPCIGKAAVWVSALNLLRSIIDAVVQLTQ